MKATILISHPFYGSSYETKKGELTKDRDQAKTYDKMDDADKDVPTMEKKYGCNCYVSVVNN